MRKSSFVRSTYGPLLYNTPGDQTFEFCVTGYGPFVSDAIENWKNEFIFLDIGANFGLFSLVAARCPNCRKAIAFEPLPEIFRRLRFNIVKNKATRKVTAVRGALVSSPLDAVYLTFNPKHSGMSKITNYKRRAIRTAAIAPRDLNAIVPRESLQILVKIDVEGAELDVLAALRQTHFYRRINGLIIEISERNLGRAKRKLLDALATDGFKEARRAGGSEHYDALYLRNEEPAQPC